MVIRDTVDGSEIGRSPVDMVKFPIIYRVSGGIGFLQQYYWNMKKYEYQWRGIWLDCIGLGLSPIPSMGLVYLPTWIVDFYGINITKYTKRPMDPSWVWLISKRVKRRFGAYNWWMYDERYGQTPWDDWDVKTASVARWGPWAGLYPMEFFHLLTPINGRKPRGP